MVMANWQQMVARSVMGVGSAAGSMSRLFSSMRIAGPVLSMPAASAASTRAPLPGMAAAFVRRQHALADAGCANCPSMAILLGGSFRMGIMHDSVAAAARCRVSNGNNFVSASHQRSISSSVPRATGLNDFFVSFPDIDKDGKPLYPAVGRAWTAAELRQKSFDDLHKLWWILLKERNSLAAERHAARARGLEIPNPQRIRKVRKSMSRIRCVLGERKRMKDLIRRQGSSGLAEQEM